MKRLFSLGTVASLVSWTCIVAFLIGAAGRSHLVLMGVVVLALVSIGLEMVLIRRKLKAKP